MPGPSRCAGNNGRTIRLLGTGALPGLRPAMIALSIRLSIKPGQTQLTRTLVAAHSSAAVLVRPINRVLAGAVGLRFRASRSRPAIEAVLMMLPRFVLSITGSTCFIPRKNADHIDVEYPAKRLQRIFGDRRDVALDAGVL